MKSDKVLGWHRWKTCAVSCFGRYGNLVHARLAQLVERNIDVVDAGGSNPSPRTFYSISSPYADIISNRSIISPFIFLK